MNGAANDPTLFDELRGIKDRRRGVSDKALCPVDELATILAPKDEAA